MKKSLTEIVDPQLKWAYSCPLNELWYSICDNYTMYAMYGDKGYSKRYRDLFEIYNTRGGKRTEKQIHFIL